MKAIRNVPVHVFVLLVSLLALSGVLGIGAVSHRVSIVGDAFAQDATALGGPGLQAVQLSAAVAGADGDFEFAVVAPAVHYTADVSTGKVGVDTGSPVKSVGVVAGIGVVISLLMSLLRSPLAGSVVNFLPPQFRVYVPLALGILASLSSLFTGLADPGTAATLALSGPAAVAFHEVVGESVMGQSRSRSRGKGKM